MQSEMMNAVKAGDVGKVNALLAEDPTLVNARDEQGNSAVLIASYWGKNAVRDVLLAHQPMLNIFEATATGAFASVKTWLARDPSVVNDYSHDGFTPLHLAVFFGHTGIAHELLKHDPDVRAVSRNPMMVQPLHSAAAGNHTEICKALLARGADVNAVQQDGFTPLMAAAQTGNLELTELFLRHGANAHVKTAEGKTARDFAMDGGHEAVASLL
jgi:ankyrin repeat protein